MTGRILPMPQVGIRERQNETSEILRAAQEQKAKYLIKAQDIDLEIF